MYQLIYILGHPADEGNQLNGKFLSDLYMIATTVSFPEMWMAQPQNSRGEERTVELNVEFTRTCQFKRNSFLSCCSQITTHEHKSTYYTLQMFETRISGTQSMLGWCRANWHFCSDAKVCHFGNQ